MIRSTHTIVTLPHPWRQSNLPSLPYLTPANAGWTSIYPRRFFPEEVWNICFDACTNIRAFLPSSHRRYSYKEQSTPNLERGPATTVARALYCAFYVRSWRTKASVENIWVEGGVGECKKKNREKNSTKTHTYGFCSTYTGNKQASSQMSACQLPK